MEVTVVLDEFYSYVSYFQSIDRGSRHTLIS